MSEAIVAKAKAIYGNQLTAGDYNNLVHKTSIAGVVSYLKETERFGRTFATANEAQIHRGQVETLLSKNVFEVYIRLCRFMAADKNSFCYFYLKECEVKQILTAIMYINAKSQDGYVNVMPAYLMDYLSFDMMALANANTYDELLDVLRETPYYDVLRPLLTVAYADGSQNLEECGIALYDYYLRWAFKSVDDEYSGEEATNLKNIFLRQCDIDNILICYRKRRYFDADTETIERSLKPFHYRMTEEKLTELLSGSDADKQLLLALKKSYFKDKIEINADDLDISVSKWKYRYYRKQLLFSENGIMALFSLISLFEIEQSNIRKIIEGIRYEISPTEIEKWLVV